MEISQFSVFSSLLLFAGLFSSPVTSDSHFTSPPHYPTPHGGIYASWADSYAKAAKLVADMTLAEKINVTTGVGFGSGPCVGNTGSVDRLGFPSICLQDSPLGVRFADLVSAFPAGVSIGATFDPELMYLRGNAMGSEARGKGVHVLLGPVVGPVGRNVLGGRNWEGSGADPYLQGVAASQAIEGMQKAGVQACVKHLVGNEQEHFRGDGGLSSNGSSSNIDDRTMHEMYLWPFADSVRAGVACIMCSYNQVNNSYACQNSKLMNGLVKDELGFQGFVLSDWLAQRAGVDGMIAGLDQTMPGDGNFWADGKSLWGGELAKGVLNGSVPLDRINDAATRIVAGWYQMGQNTNYPKVSFSSWTEDDRSSLYPRGDPKNPYNPTVIVNEHVNVQSNHGDLIKQIAAESVTLLKNVDNILPLRSDTKLALFGSDIGNTTDSSWPNQCGDRSCNKGVLGMGWGSGTCNYPYLTTPQDILTRMYPGTLSYNTDTLTSQGKATAEIPHMRCIVFITADSGEWYLTVEGNHGDRNNYNAWHNGDNLVTAVADVCPNTIVVIHSVGAISMEKWIDHKNVKAVVMAHLPGQEAGNGIAMVLTGEINPSGKLPYTIAKQVSDYGTSILMTNPNKDNSAPQIDYTEGVYIDYRHFDKYGITPRFEFGYGLSYSNWTFSNLIVKQIDPLSELPPAAPSGTLNPPTYPTTIPAASEVAWPSDIPYRVPGYIYPYLENPENITVGDKYPYPDGYSNEQKPISAAGGGEGGNPALWDIIFQVKVDLTNNGPRAGKYVTQMYVGFPKSSAFETPVRQLRGFTKLSLNAGETATVTMTLTRKDLSVWDVVRQNWVMPITESTGYTIYIGHSSRDLPLSCNTATTCNNGNYPMTMTTTTTPAVSYPTSAVSTGDKGYGEGYGKGYGKGYVHDNGEGKGYGNYVAG